MSALLDISGLASFYGLSQALHGIDLCVRPGEQVALVGRNGMGKSTLLKSIVGLVRDRRGEIRLGGASIRDAKPEAIAKAGVAYVPEGRGIFASLSVIENLLMAARPGRTGRRRWTIERVFETFPRLNERRRNGGHQLSGGEQQMLSIGRALMTNPDILLLDEATEGLAPLVAMEIWKTLGVIREEGIATIVVDKDFRKLTEIADRVLVMVNGRIALDETPDHLRAQPDLLKRHLCL